MAFIPQPQAFIPTNRTAAKVTDWSGAKIQPGDVDLVKEQEMVQKAGKPFGVNSADVVKAIFTKVVV
jgi:hypothetical protein